MTDIQGLIERLEKAEGPLDIEIIGQVICAGEDVGFGMADIGTGDDGSDYLMVWDAAENEAWSGYRRAAPDVSIDAAVAFSERVFPNVMWRVGFDPDCGWMKGELVTQAPACLTGRGWSAHAPIAILIATLRALMGKEGGDG